MEFMFVQATFATSTKSCEPHHCIDINLRRELFNMKSHCIQFIFYIYIYYSGSHKMKGSGHAGRCWIELETRRLRCAVHRCLFHGLPISYVVGKLLDRAPSERVRGRALESSPSAFILRFPRVINSLIYRHVRTTRYITQKL